MLVYSFKVEPKTVLSRKSRNVEQWLSLGCKSHSTATFSECVLKGIIASDLCSPHVRVCHSLRDASVCNGREADDDDGGDGRGVDAVAAG
jgi:hypothetical protein